jgi:hypothetical protein
LEITGFPVCKAKPAGEAKSAPTVALPTTPFVPAHTGPDQETVVSRDVFQNFAVFYAGSFRCHACGVIKHICEACTLQGEDAEFGQQLLLSNSQAQRAPYQILGNLVVRFPLNGRLVLIR